MFKKLFARKLRELEAKLYPVCSYGGKGELELRWYSDGAIKCELSIEHTTVPSGSNLEFYANKSFVGSVLINEGSGKSYSNLKFSDVIVGSEAEIRLDGVVLYKGIFELD